MLYYTIVGLHLIVFTVINRYLFLNSDVFITAVPHRDTKEQTMSWFLKCKEILILQMLKGINDKDFMLMNIDRQNQNMGMPVWASSTDPKLSDFLLYSCDELLLAAISCWWLKSLSLFQLIQRKDFMSKCFILQCFFLVQITLTGILLHANGSKFERSDNPIIRIDYSHENYANCIIWLERSVFYKFIKPEKTCIIIDLYSFRKRFYEHTIDIDCQMMI
ncbi:hypothetical protein ACJX0J_012234, partial [Zea mays]